MRRRMSASGGKADVDQPLLTERRNTDPTLSFGSVTIWALQTKTRARRDGGCHPLSLGVASARTPRSCRSGLGHSEHAMNLRHDGRAFSDSCRNAFGRARTHVADGEDALLARFEREDGS